MDTISNMHKPITSWMHGVLDYTGAALLFFSPAIFHFAQVSGPATWVARIVAIVVLIQSLLTDYEWGALKILPMRTHVINDYFVSAFLAVSPWLFGFYRMTSNVWAPHLVIGVVVFAATLLTEPFARQSSQTTPVMH